MARKIKEENIAWNEDVMARDKLLYRGTSELSNSELLSLIIGDNSGSTSSVVKAERLLNAYHNNLSEIASDSVASIKIKGALSDVAAIRLRAAVELSRRIKLSSPSEVEIIRNNGDIFALFNPILSSLRHEEFWAVYLSGTNRILEYGQISRGGVNSSVVDIKMVMTKAIKLLASSIIVVHNHPSGSSEVSEDDIAITAKLKSACKILDINMLDHVIITSEKGISLRERGVL